MKVKYLGATIEQMRWGNDGEDLDRYELLEIGETYEILNKEVHSWHTKLTLTQYPEFKFNSVCFEEI
jgi:hypothetical protein